MDNFFIVKRINTSYLNKNSFIELLYRYFLNLLLVVTILKNISN